MVNNDGEREDSTQPNADAPVEGTPVEAQVGSMTPEQMRAMATSAGMQAAAARPGTEAGGLRQEPLGNVLLEVADMKMYFPVLSGALIRRRVADVKAVDGISFHVNERETLGLVGESGCGKSTAGRAILQLHRPTAGAVWMHESQQARGFSGQTAAISTEESGVAVTEGDRVDLTQLKGKSLRKYRRQMQMIFQDPFASLDPRMSVGNIIGEPMVIHGLHRGQRKERVRDLMETVGLNPYFASRFPHEFSGGQRQRIGIARTLAVEPAFVVADEPVSALDVSIQAQIINLMEDLQADFGLTYLFIAHDLSVVRHISHRVAVMYLGKIVELATSDDLYEQPMHPYTQALISAVPIPDPAAERRRERLILTGDVPSPIAPPPGCNFHTRCPIAIDVCRQEDPEWREVAPNHWAKCHRI